MKASEDTRIGRYRLLRRLGRGGMGEVWEATLEGPAGFRKSVALKVLRPGRGDPAATDALLREARLGALLSHPNVVSTLELGEADGRWFVAMELVRGPSVRELALGPLPPAAILEIGLQACAGLAHVHGLEVDGRPAGLVHRDVKPQNLLVDRTGLVKVADLGIAALSGTHEAAMGTPGYVAPEVLDGRYDARADLFGLGVVLYKLAASRLPFGMGPDAVARLRAHVRHPRPDFLAPVEAAVPGLGEIVGRALQIDPAARYASAAELGQALRALRARLPPGASLVELLGVPREGDAVTPDLSATPSASAPTVRLGPQTNLPRPPDRFVGRERVADALLGRLQPGAVVTLLGPGGMGKTRLAMSVATRHLAALPGGAWFCDLSSVTTSDGALVQVARALGVPLETGPAAVERLSHAVRARGRVLLVLDNLEQAVDAIAPVVAALAGATPEATWLCTSRVPLKVAAELTVPLDPLEEADGLALFTARAGRPLAPTDTPTVLELVRRLDGLPLAIELAAARARVLSPAAILKHLDDRFRLLADAGRERPARHATLRASIDGSYELLRPYEQAALAQLSVVEAPFELETADAILDLRAWPGAPWTLDVLGALVDHSLLRVDTDSGRFALLHTIRDYAAERLDPAARRAAEERHGRRFATRGTEEALTALRTHGAARRLTDLAIEQRDLEVATERAVARGDAAVAGPCALAALHALEFDGDAASGVRLATMALTVAQGRSLRAQLRLSLVSWRTRGGLERGPIEREVDAITQEALEADDLSTAAQATRIRGTVAWMAGQTVAAEDGWARALTLAERAGDTRVAARTRTNLAIIWQRSGRLDLAERAFEQALAAFRAAGDLADEARVLTNLGNLHRDRGRLGLAHETLTRAIAVHRQLGNRRGAALALGNLGTLLGFQGETEAAKVAIAESIELHRRHGDIGAEASGIGHLGTLEARLGRLDEASRLFEQALTGARSVGDRTTEAMVLGNLGLVHVQSGRAEDGLRVLSAAVELNRAIGNPRGEAIATGNLGFALASADRTAEARDVLDRAFELHVRVENKRGEASTIAALARIDLREGDRRAAAERFGRAARAWQALSDPLNEGVARCGLAEALADDDPPGARDAARASLELLRRAGNDQELASGLITSARLHPGLPEATAWANEARDLADASGDTYAGKQLRRQLAGLRT